MFSTQIFASDPDLNFLTDDFLGAMRIIVIVFEILYVYLDLKIHQR
jgi:hypothetical protein